MSLTSPITSVIARPKTAFRTSERTPCRLIACPSSCARTPRSSSSSPFDAIEQARQHEDLAARQREGVDLFVLQNRDARAHEDAFFLFAEARSQLFEDAVDARLLLVRRRGAAHAVVRAHRLAGGLSDRLVHARRELPDDHRRGAARAPARAEEQDDEREENDAELGEDTPLAVTEPGRTGPPCPLPASA